MKTLGKEIKRLRLSKHLTQKDLAAKVQKKGLNCEYTYISKIENGKLDTPPSEKLIVGLAEVLEADAEQWLTLAGQFDKKELQDLIEEIPDAGILLRKLQNREFNADEIRRMIQKDERKKDS